MRPNGVADAQTVEIPSPPKELKDVYKRQALVEEIRTKFAKSQDKLANIEQSIKALG